MPCQRTGVRLKLMAVVVLAATLCGFEFAQAGKPGTQLPPFEKVDKAVLRYFQGLPNYEPGSIVTRTDVEPVFERLKQLGWVVVDRGAILSALPSDGEFLVQQLRTRAGKKFARQVAAYPDGYDRLDRLSRLPSGKTIVRDLIRAKEGQRLIEYMTTSSGGAELGNMLSRDPRGAKFNQPTGRIYTVEMLLARLKQSYAAATEAPAKPR